ncbi:capsule assembly Wzi family protein [Cyclobacterium jeungdonense]|nr:capsule assembly Wzi family protein [Cyclobacterium jeungdonense]
MKFKKFCNLTFLLIFIHSLGSSQTLPVGIPGLADALRRQHLLSNNQSTISFNIRPIGTEFASQSDELLDTETKKDENNFIFTILPFRNTIELNTKRPYGWGNGLMIPNVGIQNYSTFGAFVKLYFLKIQFQPEYVFAQNFEYPGFPDGFDDRVTRERYVFWNAGDSPEKFGSGSYAKFWWGQSKISATIGGFELGASTQNIWWGPGQFNTLTIGNNARGFPHLTINTVKPAKTFLGNFEMQLIIGTLKDSQLEPSQIPRLNQRFFNDFSGDSKYLNGFSISYNPKWVSNLFLGMSRTYQQYNDMRGNKWRDFFPVIDPFQKQKVGFDLDNEGRDQQVSVFGRYVNWDANAEVYFEYGKRDHSYNWREFILNPDHARAYLLGFTKIFDLNNSSKSLQIKGEMTHQQEAVNRYIRYNGLTGGLTWHTHFLARGFSNEGENLGVGTGVGANVQTLEFSLVEKFNKMGILLERLANHQDFYYRAFGQQKEVQPWVDLSLGLLFDHRWDNLMVSSKLQFINALNYQWQLEPDSTPEFPKGQDLFSIHSQVSLIYLFQKNHKHSD